MASRRRRVSISTADGVIAAPKLEGGTEVCLIIPESPIELWSWLRDHRATVASWVKQYGALRFRGFHAPVAGFSQIHGCLGTIPHGYSDAHTPRTKLGNNVFTSTEYPARETIELHSEMSYAADWPGVVMFFCEVAPGKGGETPIADNHAILEKLSAKVRGPFEERGVLYSRVFVPGIGLSWQRAFGVETRIELEERLPQLDVEFLWQGPALKVYSKRPAILQHPVSGLNVWFNQASSFHVSALSPSVREALSQLNEEEYPNRVCFGDGTEISDAAIAEIREVCGQVEAVQSWQQHDLLLLDNIRLSHGRRPFSGSRRILVALGDWPTLRILAEER